MNWMDGLDSFAHQSIHSFKCPMRREVVVVPLDREPLPVRGSSQFVFIPIAGCADADLCHQDGILERVVHVRDVRNRQTDVPDEFFRNSARAARRSSLLCRASKELMWAVRSAAAYQWLLGAAALPWRRPHRGSLRLHLKPVSRRWLWSLLGETRRLWSLLGETRR